MKKNANEIFMLQYRIKRYQAMGNGAMCQTLNGKLQKLLAKQATMTMEITPLNKMNEGGKFFSFPPSSFIGLLPMQDSMLTPPQYLFQKEPMPKRQV